ncbi:Terminal uridylyltransferase 4 [Stylophora pistillata]|uniref:Terminal uridylyltransferase 4 n=1 Tax=Stylophora pistillata TaxID=50429 RepID=A0A2B4RWM0_STYPI|nr:Terminal uridylyltransferase 4 [Stylophora pistillata]
MCGNSVALSYQTTLYSPVPTKGELLSLTWTSPLPSKHQTLALSKLLDSVFLHHGLSLEKDLPLRGEVAKDVHETVCTEFPEYKVLPYGSSLTGFGLKDSDVNLDLVIPDGLILPNVLMPILELITKDDKYCDVKSEFDAELAMPVVAMKQILCSDWLHELARWVHLAPSGFPALHGADLYSFNFLVNFGKGTAKSGRRKSKQRKHELMSYELIVLQKPENTRMKEVNDKKAYMNKNEVQNLTKDQLIDIIMNLRPVPKYQPKPTSRKIKFTASFKNVKQMVESYEENIIEPPLEFRDDYKPVPKPRTKKPVPLPRTRIDETNKALKEFTKSSKIQIKNNKEPLIQMYTKASQIYLGEKAVYKFMEQMLEEMMENLRKRVDVRLVTNENKLLKLASRPTFVSSKIFNENLVAVHKIKETTLNRPAFVGMCILDLSKTLMYDFHYNYIKEKYGDKAKLLFTDTDSLTCQIEAEDVYKDFWKNRDMFDNSDYDESSQYFNKENKKVIGKMKDEAAGIPIVEFVGLRSKMYSYIKDNGKDSRTAKGIKKVVIKKDIKHENYKDVLFNDKQMHYKMKTIRSQNHQSADEETTEDEETSDEEN